MNADTSTNITGSNGRGWRFWLIFLALCISLFLSALDLASVATALPVIVHDLGGTDSFAWVSAAYTLACTAILPLSGRLADIFGRRPVLLSSLFLFAVGSALSGAAQSMNVLIAGRAIQGAGSGGIQSLTAIVVADLVSLRERGTFNAFGGATFSFASVIGPFIGGAIAQKTTWRWLFYLNLPLCGIAFAAVSIFLRLRKPPVSMKESLLALDWIGNTLIIGSTVACIIALTWAGIKFPWSSAHVLVPLIIGLVGLVGSIFYEVFFASHPSWLQNRLKSNEKIPFRVISNRTSLSGYFGSFVHGIVIMAVAFYLPVYFQATKLAPPLLSGVYLVPTAFTISPAAIIQGIIVSKTGRYRTLNIIGWCAMSLGVGLLCTLSSHTPIGVTVPFQLIAAVGFGFLYATTFSVLAPLDVSANAQALSFLLFARTFSQSWSISIGATILQNQLRHRLPRAFLDNFAPGQDISYTAIPGISTLPETLQQPVRDAFAGSLQVLWKVMLVFCGVGLLSVLAQKEIPLHDKTDEKWGIAEKNNRISGDAEKSVRGSTTSGALADEGAVS